MATEGLRKPEKALTAQFVKSAKEPGKYFDGHGLFLRIQPNGARQWVQRIVIRGKRRELGLGSASLVSLAEAREVALGNRKLARAGGDPMQAKREAEAVTGGTGLVFPGTKPGKPLSDMTLSKLVKELGFDADVHGFRTSFRTWAQERTNFPREVAEAALAHTIKDKAEAAYARSDMFDKRRKMMESWAAFLTETAVKVARIG